MGRDTIADIITSIRNADMHRKGTVRILPRDRVKIEASRYDSTRGRIIYRLRNKDSND